MAAAGLFALLIGLPCLRLRGDYLAIATLGFGEVLRLTLNNVQFPPCALTGGERFGGATGIGLPNPTDYGAAYTADYSPWWLIWLGVAAVYVLLLNLKRSALGRAMMCIREDEVAARSMGIHVPRYKMLAFLVSATVAGLAGAMFVHNAALGIRVKPNDFDLLKTLDLLLMVVLGGLGSLSGSVLAAGVLVLVPEALRFVPAIHLPPNGLIGPEVRLSEHRQLLYAALLIVLIRLAPNGILGTNELPSWLRRILGGRPKESGHGAGA
jgi:branched-chain amino acid transport system permease protein